MDGMLARRRPGADRQNSGGGQAGERDRDVNGTAGHAPVTAPSTASAAANTATPSSSIAPWRAARARPSYPDPQNLTRPPSDEQRESGSAGAR